MEDTCLNCGRTLRNAVSRKAGYGPVCYKKMFGNNMRDSDKKTFGNNMRDSGKKTFGNNMRDSGKNSILNDTDITCYNMPGQITLEEYLHIILK